VDYKVTPDVLVYAGYRRGFKRGGFNSSAFGDFPPSFGPETIDSYSLGAKTQFQVAGRDVRFNVEGFYDKYKGFQASNLLLDPTTFNLVTVTLNIPKVRYYGVDTDLVVRFTDWLDFNLNYAYLKAKIRSFPDTTTPNPANPGLDVNDIPFAAEHQLQAALRFHGELEDVGEWVVRPSVSYRSEFTTTLFNRRLPSSQRALFGDFRNAEFGGATVEGVTLVDLRGELNNVAGSRFSLAVGATNLFDEYYTLGNSGTLAFGIQGNSVGPPRMVYAEVSYRF
jgi:iron complex outermembrane receptor protein